MNVAFSDDVEYSNFTYKRANHFQEWLNTAMAKQTCEVPESVLAKVMETLYRERITPAQTTVRKVREALKQCGLRKWYDQSTFITCKLTNRAPPRMTPDVENRLRQLFQQLQEPFEKCRDETAPTRKNFMSYSYVLYKLCELEGLDEFKACFTLLKGRDKLHKQDQVWKAICDQLNWTFIPSI